MNGTIGRRTGGFGFLVGGLFAAALSAQTANYHVAQGHPDASDENPGTQAAPFRTIQAAVNTARAGDTIWVREGFYEESIVISSHGRRAHPITLAAWKDDRVRMGSRPQDLPGPEAWTPIEGTKSWQLEMPEGTPGDLIVLFDGAAQPCEIRPEPPRDDQVLWSTYDPATRRLKVNAGGPNPAERHRLTLARDLSGIVNFTLDSAHWVLRGFEFGYARNFIVHFGHNILIEDCHFHHAYRSAIFGSGYLSRIRRNTFDDAALHGGPGAGTVVEDNIFYRGGRRWDQDIAHRIRDYREGSGGIMFKGTSAHVLTFRHNFCDDVGFWPDGPAPGIRLYGNAFHDHAGYAIYNEYANDDTLIIGNYMGNTQAGVASSWCSRMVVADNFIEGPGNGIILHNRDKWPLRYSFMTIRGNAIVGSGLALSGYGSMYDQFPEGWSNSLVNFNRYRLRAETGLLLDLNGRLRARTREELYAQLGWERDGEVAVHDPENNDLTPESLGGGTVTVRLPIGRNGWKSRAMLADPGITGRWPAVPRFFGNTLPAFFWRVADGHYNERILFWHGPEYKFEDTWWPSAASGYGEGEVRGCAWYIGADPIPDRPDLTWGGRLDANVDGNTFLVVSGKTPEKMLPQGAGWWTPSLPTAPGAEIDLSLRIRGVGLEAAGPDGGPAVWMRFTSLTGQHEHRVFLVGRDDDGRTAREELIRGEYDWVEIAQTLTAPPEAGRMALFLGLRPATGQVHYDDIEIKTRPGEAPEDEGPRDAEPPRVPLQRFREVFHVDLAPFANRAWADDEANNGIGGWSDQGPNCDMRAMEAGLRRFGGVPFELREDPNALVVLRSSRRHPGELPERVSLPVGREADTLFFLHASAWTGGDWSFKYVLHYADGQTEEILVNDTNHTDWAGTNPVRYFPAEEGTYSTVAVTVPSPQFGAGSLYRMEWSAPGDRRGVVIDQIEFIGNGHCVPILSAITGVMEW